MIYEIAKLGGVCRSAPVQQERSSIIHSLGDELFWLKVGFSFLLNCKLGDPFDILKLIKAPQVHICNSNSKIIETNLVYVKGH